MNITSGSVAIAIGLAAAVGIDWGADTISPDPPVAELASEVIRQQYPELKPGDEVKTTWEWQDTSGDDHSLNLTIIIE